MYTCGSPHPVGALVTTQTSWCRVNYNVTLNFPPRSRPTWCKNSSSKLAMFWTSVNTDKYTLNTWMCMQCRLTYGVVRILCMQATNFIDDYTIVNKLDVNMFITAFHFNQQYLIIRKLYLGLLHVSTDSHACRVMRKYQHVEYSADQHVYRMRIFLAF